MSIDEFGRYSNVLHGLTANFVRAVPEDKWQLTPDPPEIGPRTGTASDRPGLRAILQQLRHVVCVRGVYNAALAGKSGLDAKHDHYVGP